MEDVFFVANGVICHHNLMMFTDVDDVEFSGSREECEQYIASEAGIDVDLDLVDYDEAMEQLARDPENNGGNCDDYLMESYCDPY